MSAGRREEGEPMTTAQTAATVDRWCISYAATDGTGPALRITGGGVPWRRDDCPSAYLKSEQGRSWFRDRTRNVAHARLRQPDQVSHRELQVDAPFPGTDQQLRFVVRRGVQEDTPALVEQRKG